VQQQQQQRRQQQQQQQSAAGACRMCTCQQSLGKTAAAGASSLAWSRCACCSEWTAWLH
jgi:hypothetical protein